jgi:hypothetical protein
MEREVERERTEREREREREGPAGLLVAGREERPAGFRREREEWEIVLKFLREGEEWERERDAYWSGFSEVETRIDDVFY